MRLYRIRTYVEPLSCLVLFGVYIVLPVQRQLIYSKVCMANMNISFEDCLLLKKDHTAWNSVQSASAWYLMMTNVIVMIPSLLAVYVLGHVSETLGRRFVMLTSLFGFVLFSLVLLVTAYHETSSISWVFLAGALNGATGASAAFLMAVFAYVADRSDKQSRSRRMIVCEALNFCGSFSGALLSGVMITHFGFPLTIVVCLSAFAVAFIYALFMSESRPGASICRFAELDLRHIFALPAIQFRHAVKRLDPPVRRDVLLTTIAFGTVALEQYGSDDITNLFLFRPPLQLSSKLYGYFTSTIKAAKSMGGLIIIPSLIYWFRISDRFLVVTGLINISISWVIIGLSHKMWTVFLAAGILVFAGAPSGILRSTLSKLLHSSDIGVGFSIFAMVDVLGFFLGAIIFDAIYQKVSDYLPSLCFFLLAGLMVVPLVLSWLVLKSPDHLQSASGSAVVNIAEDQDG